MTAEENKALFIRYTDEVFTQGRHELLDEYLDPGAVDHDPVPGSDGSIPALKAFLDRRRAAFPDFHYTVEDVIAEGDKVVGRLTMHGTHQGEFLGHPPTGKPVEMKVITIVRIADGKIAEHWGRPDLVGFMRQLSGEA